MAGLLLTQRGIVCVRSSGSPLAHSLIATVELELADAGFVLSARLRERLRRSTLGEVAELRELAKDSGLRFEPLFRSFPFGIPEDTAALWWSKVLVHFLQAPGQPCLFCRKIGTTHVLDPCRHVVCDYCFDGSNYSACPVCEHKVDRSSPFFQPSTDERERPGGSFRFRLLDLGTTLDEECQRWFVSLCERRQAMSPGDRETLVAITREFPAAVLDWLPARIPVKENIAAIFGSLLAGAGATDVLARAAPYVSTATDVLRIIAVMSDTDGSLAARTTHRWVNFEEKGVWFWGKVAKVVRQIYPKGADHATQVGVELSIRRFKTARLSRPLRRGLLAMLEAMPEERRIEDMLRHRSYWIWVGEFLHPGEYAKRYPGVARAFDILRGNEGPFRTWNSRVEAALQAKDTSRMLALLNARPGELARRADTVLRTAQDAEALARITGTIVERLSDFATPVLLTLHAHLQTRHTPARLRAYWPKGQVALGALGPDRRPAISQSSIDTVVAGIRRELLGRFAARTGFEHGVIDRELCRVLVPFNERTSSASSVALPRGSRVEVEPGKLARLFLHWCQPESGYNTDLDLSVAFYDEKWRYQGVCSYYRLQLDHPAAEGVARSAGDSRNAPFPDGATEFIDIDRQAALRAGFRYAVMVVNNYAGMPFQALEHGFAGLMLRDDPGGWLFDPRSVEWRFTLRGENGVFLPLVYDLVANAVHWLDVHSAGQFEMNNVETSKKDIARICPALIEYFTSGVRPTMWDLGLLHVAARCRQVTIRARGTAETTIVRESGETLEAFHARLATSSGAPVPFPAESPILALLYRGDFDVPPRSTAYALFRERVTNPIAAADLLS